MPDTVKQRLIKATQGIIEHLEKQLAFHREALERLLNGEG